MKTIRFKYAIIILSFGHANVRLAGYDGESPQPVASQVREMQAAKDVRGLQELGVRLRTAWLAKKQLKDLAAIVEVCVALNALDQANGGIRDVSRDLAISVLDAAAKRPAECTLRLLLAVQGDTDYMSGKLVGDEWLKERRKRAERWLREWNSVRDTIVALPPTRPFFVQVSPPVETGLPAGASPEAIKDPLLRKRYEEAIKRNFENANAFREKDNLEAVEKRFANSVKRYIVEAYCKPPFATEEIATLLERYDVDESILAEIVKTVVRRVQAKFEMDVKYAKNRAAADLAAKLATEAPFKKGLAADPRLRVKLTLNLKMPKVEEVLDTLRKDTGVNLARADDIQTEYYVAGSYGFDKIHAFRIMEALASSKYIEGRWEKEGDGYRLVRNGKPVATPNPPPTIGPRRENSSNFAFWLVVISSVVVPLVVFEAVRRHRRKTAGKPSA